MKRIVDHACGPSLRALPLRLRPGEDLRAALQNAVAASGHEAAFVLSGIGSLRPASIRFAGRAAATVIDRDLELLSLAGTLAPDGAHLHLAVSDENGQMLGGHVAAGCIVRTTAEVLLALLPEWRFAREPDPDTGFAELALLRTQGSS